MASFSNAFSAARKAGKKTFTWQGKSYNTKVAKTPKLPKKGPVPTAKPTAKTGATASAKAAAPKARADFPKPAKGVGIAKPGSRISKAVARKENAPKSTVKSDAPAPKLAALGRTSGKTPVPTSSPNKADLGKSTGKTPIPASNPRNAPAVGIARKGSPLAIAAQRRKEAPVKDDKPIDALKYSPTPLAKAHMGDLTGPKFPKPKKK